MKNKRCKWDSKTRGLNRTINTIYRDNEICTKFKEMNDKLKEDIPEIYPYIAKKYYIDKLRKHYNLPYTYVSSIINKGYTEL